MLLITNILQFCLNILVFHYSMLSRTCRFKKLLENLTKHMFNSLYNISKNAYIEKSCVHQI